MIRELVSTGVLLLGSAATLSAQSPATNPPESTAQAPAPASKEAPKDPKDTSAPKKHPKKVWTNDEMPSSGGISVVGDSVAPAPSSKRKEDTAPSGGSKEKQIAAYRKQLATLRGQLDATDKKISELRNFKGDNSSSTGGVTLQRGYSMTPIEDQVKQQEAKRKQLQDAIDEIEEQARKSGIEAGELR